MLPHNSTAASVRPFQVHSSPCLQFVTLAFVSSLSSIPSQIYSNYLSLSYLFKSSSTDCEDIIKLFFTGCVVLLWVLHLVCVRCQAKHLLHSLQHTSLTIKSAAYKGFFDIVDIMPEKNLQSGLYCAAPLSVSADALTPANSHLIFSFILWLTQADRSHQAQAILWGEAGGEEGLQDVVWEGESDHSLVSGVDYQHRNPQTQKAGGTTKGRRLKSHGHRTCVTHQRVHTTACTLQTEA